MDKNRNPLSEIGKQNLQRPIHWDDAKVFLAIAREGTLSGAAKQLKLGVATTSRRLERLEQAFSARLFTRDQLGYQLTDEGHRLVAQAEALEQAGYAFGATLQGGDTQIRGHVRLATAQGLADNLIIPALPTLLNAHPQLTVEINTGVTTVNLHRRDADIALRMVRPERGNVSIRRLGELGFGLYAAPSYLARRAKRDQSGAYEQDDFIGWSEAQQHLPAAQWLEKTLRGRACRLMTTTLSAQVNATRAGIGLAVLPHLMAQQQGLVCLEQDLGCDQPIWLAIHSDLSHSRRVRAVADFLSDLIKAQHNSLAIGEHKLTERANSMAGKA